MDHFKNFSWSLEERDKEMFGAGTRFGQGRQALKGSGTLNRFETNILLLFSLPKYIKVKIKIYPAPGQYFQIVLP